MNIYRKKITLEDRFRSGETLSDKEKQNMQTINARKQCIKEFLKVMDTK